MDAQQTNSRRVRILQRACVAILGLLIAAVLWQGYGPWLLSPRQHVTIH